MNSIIRPAALSDAPAIASLLKEVGWFEIINRFTDDEAIVHVAKYLAQCLADGSHSVYVGVDEADSVTGYVNVHWLPYFFMPGPEGYISELFLRPSARGQGLGAALLETVKTEAEKRGVYRLSLLNGKHRESYERGFYTKQGWDERPLMANFVYKLETH